MSIYEACDKMGSVLATITAPQTPTSVRVVPPGHGDDRHAARAAGCWINVEPVGETHEDETNSSDLVVYTCRFHGWYAAPQQSITTAAQKLGTLGDSIIAALKHNDFSGWARYGIAQADIDNVIYETSGETDTAYVVRGDVRVHRQQ